MEHTPAQHSHRIDDTAPIAEHTPRRQIELRITDALLEALPPAQEAPSFVTALLADQIRQDYFNALSESREISTATARAIAYSLTTHAPARVDALHRYAATGQGTRAALRGEYQPLAQDPGMVAEGRLLLDVLGTHLFRKEHPDTIITVPRDALAGRALDGALFYTEVTGDRHAVAFQLPHGTDPTQNDRIVRHLERGVARYGDPFRAFLCLPGIDSTSPGLINYFLRIHHAPEHAAGLVDATVAPPSTGGAMPAWEGVEVGGQIHAFTR